MDFLMSELNVHTCVYVWNIGAAYGLGPVRDAARRFVLENFAQFAETPQFTQLTLEQIIAFLQDDNLTLPSEVTTFQVGSPVHTKHKCFLLSQLLIVTLELLYYTGYVNNVHTNGEERTGGRGGDSQTLRRAYLLHVSDIEVILK